MTDFLIKDAVGILTGLPGDAARTTGDIRVVDGRIAEIGQLEAKPDERIVDASGAVITPGLVNTHHHLFQSVLKAVPAGMNEALNAWLRVVPYQFWNRLDEDAVRVAVTIGLAEMALSGVTTVADHHYFYPEEWDFDPNEILFETAERFGMRFVLCRGGATKARSFDTTNIALLPTEPLDTMIERVSSAVGRWHDPSPEAMRRVVFAPTTPTYSLDVGELRVVAETARELGIRRHSHLSENGDYVRHTLHRYGKRPVQWLADHDWLGPDVWFAHLVECDVHELELLAETGTGMAHCPQANSRLGSGVARAAGLDAIGGTVSLAVDGAAANEAADMASAMYSAFSIHRAVSGVGSVKAETVLKWASAGGAKVLGFDSVGTIEVGKAADISIHSLDSYRFLGQHDQVLGPIISGGDARIRYSFVGGKPVVENGEVPWIDFEQLADNASVAVGRLMSN